MVFLYGVARVFWCSASAGKTPFLYRVDMLMGVVVENLEEYVPTGESVHLHNFDRGPGFDRPHNSAFFDTNDCLQSKIL